VKSIHQRLRFYLLTGLLTSSLIVGVMVFLQARHEMSELYDAHLRQIALLISELPQQSAIGRFKASSLVTDEALLDWEEEDFLIQIWDKSGRLVHSLPQLDSRHALPLQQKEGRHSVENAGMEWNLYRANGENYDVQVAQPERPRASTIRETSLYLLIPLLLQVPAFVFIASLTTRQGLAPLRVLSSALRLRHPWALDELPTAGMPEELQPLGQALNQLLEQLSAVLAQQRSLLSDAAHELRTPIAALRLQIDAYHRADNGHEREECLSALERGISRSSALVNQLLLYARSEARTLHLPATTVTFEQIATEVMSRHLPMARARQVDLGLAKLSKETVHGVVSDIETVIDNLISNAINYSREGARVDLALYTQHEKFIIEVVDQGIGIPLAERERVFDRFYRVANTANDGTGLGLAIVRMICERNGATVTIHDPESGVGTLFRVIWPQYGQSAGEMQ
jgi:signal transduction histidine kinase